ncbi:MAG: glycosyltransferase family 2 protein [Planctomycetes bacterium]|nr:glycosyltransferase family 2 protein [Planctomycetota bacterium]
MSLADRPDPGREGAPNVSIVVPLYNEQDSVGPLWTALAAVLPRLPGPTEVILVDDGSTDATGAILKRLRAEGAPIRILKLKRNFGQTPALAAGLDRARGRIVVTLDGDLQNDPADIPRLLAEIDRGYDLVCGWRRDRHDPFLTRVLPSRIANWLIGRITGVRIHDYGCTLKAFRSEVVRHLNLYADQHRFIPAIAAGHGARVSEIPVRHHPRRFGASKYGIGRTLRVLFDLVTLRMCTRFAARPGHWFGVMSLPFLGLGVLTALATAVNATKLIRLGDLDFEYAAQTVLPSTSFLLFYLAFHLISLGFLSELFLKVSDHKMTEILDVAGV